ncbi:efflux RND transporter periplasmic adaptor subunit [uncultured Draconibacterium sp.]|uniref:efflux RND transporter periplasmic adaptor subunit n=1 Tax=uncultured Draconibacterium sp. TaxID=1573823 RepID=UPI0025F1A904|nr:efflux RND transporter periplasmic adaptor subunit [uncultured Draconibacterium sp.]
MKNIKNLLFVFAMALAAVACNNRPESETTELAVPVSVQNVKKGSISQFINTTGTAKSLYETNLVSEVAGEYLLQTNPATGRPFKLGDKVKKGQVIVVFEDDEYVNGLAIESKKLNLEISEDEYEKQKSLYEKGGVTLRELRNSEVSKTNARYDYESAEIRLAKMSVVAPFSGVIVELPYYTQGTRITTGQPIVSLMSYDKMYIEINLPEKNISEVKIGQEVLITNYTISEDTLIGKVSELSPMISSETRTFSGKLQINNPDLKLRPGMFVKADIITDKKDSVLVIPKNVILTGNRGKYVFVVERNSAADDRRITTGIENKDFVEIVEGLKENDRLIIKGFETLRDNSKVKIIL